MLSKVECGKIFDNYIAMAHAPDQVKSRLVADQLSNVELEGAARRSYAYHMATLHNPEMLTKEITFATAMREANRHLDGVDDVEISLGLLKASLQFHQQNRTHTYATCMEEDFQYADSEDAKVAAERRLRITKENRDVQAMIIRGQDKENNAVWVAMPRKQSGDDPQGFVDQLLYTIERCAATTEALTLGKSDRMVAVIDLKKSASPTMKAMKMGISVMQAHYPGRLKNLIVLDLNYILQGVYNCIKPFLDPETRSKFLIVSGTKAKEAAVSMHIEEAQAQSNMLKNGKLSPDVDGEFFVQKVPFCRLYDHVRNEPPTNHSIQSMVYHNAHGLHHSKKDARHTPASAIRSPRIFKSKARSLAVGSLTSCMTSVSLKML